MLTLPFTVTYIITDTVWKCFTHSEEIYSIIPKRIYYTYYSFLDNSDFDLNTIW